MLDPPLRVMGAFTDITNEIVPCEVTESVTVIVSRYVPWPSPVVVIAPVAVLIESPDCGGEIAKVFVWVPPVTVKAEEVKVRPCVVVKDEMPVMVIVSFTVKTTLTEDEPFNESVAVIDSLYVPVPLGSVERSVT
jgi:hypothetical protein